LWIGNEASAKSSESDVDERENDLCNCLNHYPEDPWDNGPFFNRYYWGNIQPVVTTDWKALDRLTPTFDLKGGILDLTRS